MDHAALALMAEHVSQVGRLEQLLFSCQVSEDRLPQQLAAEAPMPEDALDENSLPQQVMAEHVRAMDRLAQALAPEDLVPHELGATLVPHDLSATLVPNWVLLLYP